MRTAVQEGLQIELTLTLGGQSFSIPGGQVKHLSVHLATHGFTASVTFWSSLQKKDSALFTALQKPDLLQVRLSVAAGDASPPTPLVLQGLVRSRRVTSESHGISQGVEHLFRRFTLEFADPAQVLWRQHRPIDLYTNISMMEVIEAHKANLQISYDWTVLKQKQPMLCLALGADAPGVSFYDFVLWYVATNNGVWSYDSHLNQYWLTADKPTLLLASPLSGLQVQDMKVHLPPPIRHATRVLNAVAHAPTTAVLEQPQAVAGVSHDVMLRTPLATQAEQRQKLEKTRLQPRQSLLDMSFKHFPTVDIFPGALLRLEGPLWPSGLKGLDEDQRVLSLDLEAHALNEGVHDDQQNLIATYENLLSVRLEPASETLVNLPAYRTPRYPIHVEGLVHSPGGDAQDRRYLIVEDEKTSLHSYRMTVPLWNQTVDVPAEPNQLPGHFFFPPYKNTRVLVALHFEHAELVRFIDWKEGVRTPQDGQGDQALLGWNKTSQTAFTHDFQDDNPVWRIHRTSGGDTQIVRMGEGHLFIQVQETPGVMAPTPTYDVSPQVDAAKADLSASVGGALAESATAYQAAMGTVRAKMQSAHAETKAALSGAKKEVGAKVAEAKSGFQEASARLSQGSGQLSGNAAEAKASLEKLR
ncbi:hypothetical protein [Stigmatella aurantiaca]|uniref:Uncharacterized protein n=1 Tax=Stigmatella aurantiaca (strain DW4/3-1) TaxID=378806 RepID=Q09CH3_STIAD|nr:hypothetical protein [Stigmatella aurantiaca]ADO69622.1 uncharacterized protein STAUR_1818 [Stigmatella aurantiaca DW4/3-1]EAU69361.1 hypothetical protein STIAU_3664 [Stigmatella aurantiaca DW4/3-1]